jgi:hypothetical protein
MGEQAPEHQSRGLFGLLGKKEEEGNQTNVIHNHTTTPNYPADPLLASAAAEHSHGHAGQLTAEEAEQEKNAGLLGKIHRKNSASSSSSRDEEEGGEEKRQGARKKKGVKENLPAGRNSSDQCGRQGECGGQGEKKEGLVDKIKDKLPGHRNTNE